LTLDAARRSDLTLDGALAMARRRPEVRLAEAEVESARARAALERRERIPDITVSGGYKEQADGFAGAVLGLSVPLPLLDRNRGRIAEAEAARRGAEARLALALRTAEGDARSAWERHRTLLERLVIVNRGLLAESSDLLNAARVAYAEGEMTLVELLDAAEAHRAARQIAVELLRDAAVGGFDLERAVGATQDLPPFGDTIP
jgi:cobalt-zinc-cadmium efflux system outer membrane protein